MARWHVAAVILGAGMILAMPHAGSASRIKDACVNAGRPNATLSLCNCIQRVANQELSAGDRRQGARIFADPHLAQELRQSDRRSDEIFWERWKAFGAQAERTCG